MKKNSYTTLLVTALALTTANVSHAMSEFVYISAEPLWPTSSTPDGNLVYSVTTVGRAGSGLLEVTLSASNMPPGVTVTFSPSVLRFTGNQVTSQSATMTVHCPTLMPLDCYPFTLTGGAPRESLTVTNPVLYTSTEIATRRPTLRLDKPGNGTLKLRGLGATGKAYQIESRSSLADTTWTPVGSASADGNGRFTFFPAQTNGVSMRFFRAVQTAP